jgi:hypothetical protein
MAYELQEFVNKGKYIEADKKAMERKLEKQDLNKASKEQLTKEVPKENTWKTYFIIVIFVVLVVLIILMIKYRENKKIITGILIACIPILGAILMYTFVVSRLENTQQGIITHLPNQKVKENLIINSQGDKIINRFSVPKGYERMRVETDSYGEYLRNFPLKPNGAPVQYFDGRHKSLNVHEAVLDIDVGDRDLQQCADAVMRLWAEYNYKKGDYGKIHFNFTNGFRADYSKWRDGNIIRVSGNDADWEKTSYKLTTYRSFRNYLDMVFSYAGTLSLSQEMKKVSLQEMQMGDVFLKGNDPGHCVVVVDVAINKENGKKVFMIAQSYMPAQDIHILKNNEDREISPWYQSNFGEKLITPEWVFTKEQLYRFAE